MQLPIPDVAESLSIAQREQDDSAPDSGIQTVVANWECRLQRHRETIVGSTVNAISCLVFWAKNQSIYFVVPGLKFEEL